MVFVGGEAGAGKTSLIEALRARLPARTPFLYGACDPLEVPRPLAPLLDVAGGILEELRELVSSGSDRQTLFSALADALRTAQQPLLIVFEDVHWSDDATQDLLRFLGRRIETFKVTLVVTYRDDEVGTAHPVRRLLGDLARVSNVHRLHVPALSLAAVRDLIGDRGLDPEQVHARTGGNAYFVSEVIAVEGNGVPVKAGDAVLARAARLSPSARRVLELAALARHHVDVALLNELASPAAVDECCEAGLLLDRQGKLTFRHEIAREAIDASVGAGRRKSMHAELFRALEADRSHLADEPTPGPDEATNDMTQKAGQLAVLAFHAHEAGHHAAVLRYAVAAGRLALRLHAYREAWLQFTRALPHSRALPPAERARLFEDHGRLGFVVDDIEGAAASRSEAAAMWQQAGDPEGQVRNLRQCGAMLMQLGRHEEAEAVLADAHRLADSLPQDSVELAAIYADKAWPDTSKGAPDKVWIDRTLVAASVSGHHEALAVAHVMNGYLHLLAGRVPAGRRELARAVSVAATSGREDLEADTKSDAAALLSVRLRYAAAEPFLEAAISLARDKDMDCTLNFATANKARAQFYLGRWDETAASATWILERPNASKVPRIRALTMLGLLRVRRGDPDADPLLDEALDEALKLSSVVVMVQVRAARAEAALSREDPDAALLEATADLQMALDDGTDYEVAQLGYLIWKAGGRPPDPMPRDNPFTWQVEGRPLQAGRRWRRLSLPYEQARALSETDDVDHMLEALRIFTELGATPARARTAERLRQLGARGIPRGPRPATQANPVGLTPREMQVLQLLASGMRNGEIAEQNHVSHRTVDNQVSAVLAKLEARSRGEAVAKAYRIGIIGGDVTADDVSRSTSAT